MLDPEQNHGFRDHFLNLPFNLSRVLFIATANEIEPVPRPLRDRVELLEMTGYTVEEKVQIARRHLLPKQLGLHGLTSAQLSLADETLDLLISRYTREAGVRELERLLGALCRSVAVKVAEAAEGEGAAAADGAAAEAAAAAEGAAADDDAAEAAADDDGAAVSASASSSAAALLSVEDVEAVLGPPKFDGPKDAAQRLTKPGIAMGLAYTPVGGDVLFVEASRMAGRGMITLTGQLGEVMQESAKTALSWIRAHASELTLRGVAADSPFATVEANASASLLDASDVHVHFPAGGIPKDGPSAGVALVTSLVSLFSGRVVRSDTAMTGEVTLRGLVLPIGGVKEKVIAAHRAGLRTVILPARNQKDLRELPESVLEAMNFTFVTEVQQVLDAALLPPGVSATDAPPSEEGGDDGDGDGDGEWEPPARPARAPEVEFPPAPGPAAAGAARRAVAGGDDVARAARW